MRTWLQSASSSSASIMGSAVCTPWPISECGTITVTVPSGAIFTQVVSSAPSPPASARARGRFESGEST
jgi:hypothetical protein